MVSKYLPHYAAGEVIKGFGRGSKSLGCPTANFPLSVVHSLPADFPLGVYSGWAKVDNGPVYKMVMNIGWCPFYQNKEKSMETHIIHKFENDFYGAHLKICIVEYLRPEMNFNSLDELISAIQNDIENAKITLDKEDAIMFKNNNYFE